MKIEDSPHIRLLVVDDHPVVRAGWKTWLQEFDDLRVVAEAPDGASALAAVADEQIDVAIVDIGLPDMDGIETAARIRERQPATRIILISGVIDQAAFQRGLKAGVLGFAVKSLPLEHVVRMIRDVHAGAFCCCPELTGMLGNWADAAPIPRALAALSSREREILSVLAEGASVKQAAVRLGITYKSADHLKQRVMKKLDLHDRVELVKFAMREGLCGKSTAPETEPMCW